MAILKKSNPNNTDAICIRNYFPLSIIVGSSFYIFKYYCIELVYNANLLAKILNDTDAKA